MNPEGKRTAGEMRFEQYLESQGLRFEFEKEHAGKSKHPDYKVEWKAKPVILDVKDFDPPAELGGFRYFDPYRKIREKINQVRDQFKQFKDFPCGLVLCNLGTPDVDLENAAIMLGAMYDDAGFTFPVVRGKGDETQIKHAFLEHGKMIRAHRKTPQNTTISALITLTRIRPHYQRVIVWHNAFARIPFPEDLFCGPYDTHFGIVKEDDGTFQRVTYCGSLLPT